MNEPSSKKQTIPQSYSLHFAISIGLHFIIGFLSQYLPRYGYQYLLTESKPDWINFVTNFDGYHYLFNEYEYLTDFAFLPGYTVIVRTVSIWLPLPIIWLFALNLMFFWFSIRSLAKICDNLGVSKSVTQICVFLFIYNPSAVFFHSIYSESLYSFLTFNFIQIQTSKQKNKKRFKSLLILATSVIVRSTSLFLLPVIGIPILNSFFKAIKERKFTKAFQEFVQGLSILLVCVSVFVVYLIWAQKRVCGGNMIIPECESSYFVNIYSYVQSKFWNVGFLTYFQASNAIFILMGAPSILFTLLFFKTPQNLTQFSLCFSFSILLAITILMTNIQSGTRFLCSHPVFYINAGIYIGQSKSKLERLAAKLFKIWQLSYFYVGYFLFCLEFPWT